MGTDFAYNYANLTMGYHEITVYFIIRQIYALASKPFEKASFRYLGDCQILLKVNLITTDRLLSIKKTIFLVIMINQSGTKIWIDVYNNPIDSKQYVPFTSNHPRHFLTNIPFSFERKICTIVENKNIEEKRFKELKENIAITKIT